VIKTGNDWEPILQKEAKKDYYLQLRQFLKQEYETKTIYPPAQEIFSAMEHTSYKDTNVVILGQDPYINKGEAHGMAFSVNLGCKIPPSLKNVFKEINEDVGCKMPTHGNLLNWAKQGVLLLNTVLTVQAGNSKSHAGKGWEQFTNNIITHISQKQEPVVFLLWGRDAEKKRPLINEESHKVFVAAHPSPLAGGRFFGCKHFSKANDFLKSIGKKEIDWSV